MKILYLTALDELDREKCGILGKIRGQISSFQSASMDVHFGHYHGADCFVIEHNDNVKRIKSAVGTTRTRLGSIYGDLIQYITTEGIKTVYIRFTSLDAKAISFYTSLKKEGIKVIIEFYSHNLELEAKKTARRNISNKEYLSAVKGYASLYINKWYFSKLKNCIDLIVTTTKVGDMYGVRTINVVNGINTAASKMRVKTSNEYDFNIVSVAMISIWHGYDRVIRGIAEYYNNGGTRNILYTVVGDGDEKKNLENLAKELKVQDHVIFTGIKLNEEIDPYYNTADIALEMLAGFRRTKGQISSIKMAEYFAKGIPVLYAADQKLYDGDMEKYCYWVPNVDSAIDIGDIISFCDRVYQNDAEVEMHMHQIAKEKFDWTFTMKELIAFILED